MTLIFPLNFSDLCIFKTTGSSVITQGLSQIRTSGAMVVGIGQVWTVFAPKRLTHSLTEVLPGMKVPSEGK